MLILPAIDLIGGKCVRLNQGDYARETVYDVDPVTVAKTFESQGATWLHVVDLEGAKSGKPANLEVLRRIALETGLSIEFGGGVRSLEDAAHVLECGAKRAIIGTKVVQDPELAKRFFSELGEQIVAGLDARDGFVAVAGWVETSKLSLMDAARLVEAQGAKRVIVTDIARDGMLQGPNLELLAQVLDAVSIPVIQSGGISCLEDVVKVAALPCEGVIIGKAIYENRLDLAETIRSCGNRSLDLGP